MERVRGSSPQLQGVAGLAAIVGGGLATGALTVRHTLRVGFGPGEAMYLLTPMVVSVALIVVGAVLWARRIDGPGMLRIGGWMFVGMLVFGLAITWTITHEAIRGDAITHGLFLTTNSVAIGGFIGVVLGWLDVRNRRYERQLERERAKLQDRIEQLDDFASVVSHDLRNPLNVARGQLDLARSECESDHLDEVAVSHQRMETLIEDLLTLAREGTAVTDPEPVALASLVDACWTTVRTPDAELVVEIDRAVRADETRLKQAIENLIRNAIEHGREDVTVTVGELDDGFYVEDDGPGIPTAKREDVFETGFTTSAEGTGLGLSIVQRIVEAHGWDVRATEGADGGARFEITGVSFVAAQPLDDIPARGEF